MKIIIITNIMHFQKNDLLNNTKILYYHIIDFSQGIDVNEASASKERIICH